MPLRVLLTGHNGYIGSVLGPFLQACGHVVVGLDSGLYRDCTLGLANPGIPCLWKDVRDVDSDLLRRFDAVIHLASVNAGESVAIDQHAASDINHAASVRLTRLARKARVKRFLLASSCASTSAEDTESEVLALTSEEFSVTALRLPQVFGWSPRFRADLPVNRLAAGIFSSGAASPAAVTHRAFPLLHVEDCASAFATALLTPAGEISGRGIDIAFERMVTTVGDLAGLLQNVYPDCLIRFERHAEDIETASQPSPQPNFDAVKSALPGCFPRWTLAAGLQQMADAFCRHGWDPDPAATRMFDRSARLEWLVGSGALLPDLRWKRGMGEEIASWAA